MAGSKNTKLELIRVVTLDNDAQSVVIDTDQLGNSFVLNGFVLAVASVGASSSTSEGYLKIAVNSNVHGTNRIADIEYGIRKNRSTRTIILYEHYLPDIGHFGVCTQRDNWNIINSSGEFVGTLYNNGGVISISNFTNQTEISSIFVGTDNATLKMGTGSIIALYGFRK